MTDIFISYTATDRKVAARLAARLQEDEGWDVFWDRKIETGAEWNDEIQYQLRHARCVIVLWSSASRKSLWVKGEAAEAHDRNVHVPVVIDKSRPPRLFSGLQTASLDGWVARDDQEELDRLKSTIRSRIGQLEMYGNLTKVADGEPVTAAHLNLVHSCWRVDKDTNAGLMPYQIHLIVFGHASAMSQIESVVYKLPGYPPGHDRQSGGPPERLFELMELANGFSIAQAEVRIKPPGRPRVLHLSRLINMSESGPRLLDDFIRRQPPPGRLKSLLKSLPAAEAEAERLLGMLDRAAVLQRLVEEGVPAAMAESALATAEARVRRRN